MSSHMIRAATLVACTVLLAGCGSGDQPVNDSANAAVDAAANAGDGQAASAGDASPAPATGGDVAVSTGNTEGEALYARCVACHQTTGTGLPGAFPPLAGSEWATGNPAVPIRILLHGLQGAITVAGAEYNSVMLPYGGTGEMSDAEVAAVLTYVRSAFGNSASAITAEQVAAERAATAGRNTQWTAAELQPLLP